MKKESKEQQGIRIGLALEKVTILMKTVMGYLTVRKNVNKILDFSWHLKKSLEKKMILLWML